MEHPKSLRGEEWKKRRMIRACKDCTVWLMYDKYGKNILVALARPFDLNKYLHNKRRNRLR